MTTINIGGVPEHFNLAWYLTLRNGEYKREGINLRWKDFFGGTGQMNKALRDKEIDMAVILTEGIIKDIIDGNPCKIVQTFVNSSLQWGIHVAKDSKYHDIDQLKGTKAAISRFGSGSHLMAYINAKNNGWDLEKDLKFEVIKNLAGAVEGLSNGVADYFMWEKYTTQPFVDNGTFRRIGVCPTPWPCFVVAVREDVLDKNLDDIKTIMEIINTTTREFKHIPSIDTTIANRYDLELEDVQEWLSMTEWSQELMNKKQFVEIQDHLLELNLIPRIAEYEFLTFKM
ncbi:MAG: PhnD/SsuA/transferrin family substrate-binding protein [Bacteroidia bacterium]|nr:PhnD/SsuA/transferrin family substrate-binding protein [Bacteroidia bacterium]NND09710.1 PhnD/SsuA/transferrin family substrate-binding protein [Flavobacteriaceae bacterium]MBT8309357.1 PhnD/SsuA/transferrin family substrate-binding protein [Bacteroidia bacterium]NNK27167.1 PhnD/SsuA/transferrin family substrate-binding protein [Flavobacteriaceae bacterium]NNL60839.1 PhnD/SsuA/transferrin family substrate-binding protein [Flavobacteriaceae bacterium]